MDVRDLSGRTALVTGAASGIGRASALAFGRHGADLVICDLDEAGLAATGTALAEMGRRVLARRVDVADPAAMERFAAEVEAETGTPDLLMNNAGVGLGARFLDTTLEDWNWIVGINLLGVVHGCHFFVPRMIARGRGGHVVNTASAAAYTPSDVLAAYATTKYAVLGLSESLRIELAPHGIGVTALCPGIIDTPITRSSRLRGSLVGAREQMAESYRRRGYTPERVAENLLKAIAKNRAIAPVSPEAWIGYYLKRLSPALVRWIGAAAGRRSLPAQK
jgi:NAD(P)-dependent dehydrogenase (short-subunit alcohol dehydrogenase family)